MQETLSERQQIALDNFTLGNNIFLTGPGGSGKTFLIKKSLKNAMKIFSTYKFVL